MNFGGDTYQPEYDLRRLVSQLARVKAIMSDGRWRTLSEIQYEFQRFGLNASEAAISARLRDLRKEEYGEHEVQSRARGERRRGLFEYRVILNQENLRNENGQDHGPA